MQFKAIVFCMIFFTSLIFGAQPDTNSTNIQNGDESSLFVSIDDKPAKIYKNDLFSLTLKALVGVTNDLGSLSSTLTNYNGVRIVSQSYKWRLTDDGSFKMTLYLKATDDSVKLPDIKTSYSINGVEKASSTVEGETMQTTATPTSAKYCGVLASSLQVTNYKLDSYDGANNILVLDIASKNANIEDFKIPGIAMQGLNAKKSGGVYYYVIIPANQQTISFDYFNKNTQSLETVNVTLDMSKVDDSKVSTQTDLSPKNTDKATYVFIVVALLVVIFYAIYYFRREKIFLLLIGASIIGGIIFLFIPNAQVVIKKDTIVYILPTENSTAFFQATSDLPAEKLKENEGYIKIKMRDGKIGWVKAENVVNR